jgi:hypothetical protein
MDGETNGLDNFRGFARFVGSRAGHFLYDGGIHSHPADPGTGYLPDPNDSGPKSDFLKLITMLGILLAVLGVFALAYQGFSYTHREKILDLGPIHATLDDTQHIAIPPVTGASALVGGAALLIIGAKQKPKYS